MSTVVGVIPLSSLLSLATMTMNEKAKSSQFPNSDPSSPRRRRRRLCLCLCRPPSPPPHPPRHGHKLFLRVQYNISHPCAFRAASASRPPKLSSSSGLASLIVCCPLVLVVFAAPANKKRAQYHSVSSLLVCLRLFISLIQNNIFHDATHDTMPRRRCSTT